MKKILETHNVCDQCKSLIFIDNKERMKTTKNGGNITDSLIGDVMKGPSHNNVLCILFLLYFCLSCCIFSFSPQWKNERDEDSCNWLQRFWQILAPLTKINFCW